MKIIIFLLIFLCVGARANEFIFWAQLTSKDFVLHHLNEAISSAMTSKLSVREIYVCDILYTDDESANLPRTALGAIDDEMPKKRKLAFLNAHKNELLNCFQNADIKVQDFSKTINHQNSTQTFIKILPIRFRVNFARDRAVIFRLEDWD